MKNEILFARVYVTEGDKLLAIIMKYLHDEIHIKGVTVFRAITGFGKSGALHSSVLLTMSMDLPLVVEFFDETKKVEKAIEYLTQVVGTGHIVAWPALIN